ncbi:hypothetical protein B0H19DRAFT_1061835 [Mycena capillaripes]|nr:hypothetical protein B0H19DRAFT_1061835 [Mycena capillaripes]
MFWQEQANNPFYLGKLSEAQRHAHGSQPLASLQHTYFNVIQADLDLRDRDVVTAHKMLERSFRSWTIAFLAHSTKSKQHLKIHKTLLFLGDDFLVWGNEDTAINMFTVALDGFTYTTWMFIAEKPIACEKLKAAELWEMARGLFERWSQAQQGEKIEKQPGSPDKTQCIGWKLKDELRELPIKGKLDVDNEKEPGLIAIYIFVERRYYPGLNLAERQLRQIFSRAHLARFQEHSRADKPNLRGVKSSADPWITSRENVITKEGMRRDSGGGATHPRKPKLQARQNAIGTTTDEGKSESRSRSVD